jgi:hypothetical protein
MFSAADLILALQRRMLLRSPQRRRPVGEFPPGWQAWFEQMRERMGAVTGATSEAIVNEFLQRPLAMPPRRTGELTRWQAFATLWRQQWHPPEPEERKVRWIAGIVSVLWHLFFGALLVWLMYLRFMALGTPAHGEDVVKVEYIGRGTPQQPGGPQPEPTAPAQPQPARPVSRGEVPTVSAPATSVAPAEVVPRLEMPPPDVAQREVPEPVPAAEQPVTVSEPVPSEPSVFVLPPTRRRVEERAIAPPDLRPEPQQVRVVEVPEPLQPRQRELPQREVETPALTAPAPEVAAREIPTPLRRPVLPEVKAAPTSAPELRQPTPIVRTAEIPTPQKAITAESAPASVPAPAASAPAAAVAASPAAASSGSAPAQSASTQPSSTQPSSSQSSSSQSSSRPAPAVPAATAGTGPKPTATPGGWPSPRRGDDWGESTRERPGGRSGEQPGLYNPDGSMRLSQTPGSAAPAEPPGTVTEEIKDLDRAGTWLKRKPAAYEPSAFDKYWRPSETLLQEWVRRSIKRVAIPIPGTSKRIVCDVALLAFGGGCGIVDPNLHDQPASARPPPDIPFKPELQDDNGSIKP